MDREVDLIKAVSDLATIVSGIQNIIKAQTECIALLKERLEALEVR